VIVERLLENTTFIPTVARWLYEEWGTEVVGRSLATSISSLEQDADAEGFPLTLIGKVDNEVVATASLVRSDMDCRPDLTPWMASVYVDPAHREKEYGSLICLELMQYAQSINLKELYLYTPDRRSFYERIGWKFMNTEHERGKEVSLMKMIL